MKLADQFPTIPGFFRRALRQQHSPTSRDLAVTVLTLVLLLAAWSVFVWVPFVVDLLGLQLPTEPLVPFVAMQETLENPGCVRSSLPSLAFALVLAGFVAVLVEAVKCLRRHRPDGDPVTFFVMLIALQIVLPVDVLRSMVPDWFTGLLASVGVLAWPVGGYFDPDPPYPMVSAVIVAIISTFAIISFARRLQIRRRAV